MKGALDLGILWVEGRNRGSPQSHWYTFCRGSRSWRFRGWLIYHLRWSDWGSMGVDEIFPEYNKSLDIVGLSWPTCLCNIMWQAVPLDWVTGVVDPLFFEGGCVTTIGRTFATGEELRVEVIHIKRSLMKCFRHLFWMTGWMTPQGGVQESSKSHCAKVQKLATLSVFHQYFTFSVCTKYQAGTQVESLKLRFCLWYLKTQTFSN